MSELKEATFLGQLGIMAMLTLLTFALMFGPNGIEDPLRVAEIGGIAVPPISCQEDEVISWIGVDLLGCVHFEEVDQ